MKKKSLLVKMTPKSFSEIILFFLIAFQNTNAKPKPKSNPEADPKAWDWQNEPHNKLPVFSPYQEVTKYTAHDQPSFLKINRNITVKLGETAYLPCRVKNLHKYTVSWIRSSDVSVLSVGHLAFSSDARIGVVQVDRPVLSASDWNLSILNSSKADDGMYECQVNTEPKINYKVFLSVQDPADALQKDSPYYEIEPLKNGKKGSDYEKTHSLVKKHHITQIEKEGFSMYLHDNGCICPKPQIVTRDRHGHRRDTSPEMTVTGGPIHYFSVGDQMSLECVMTGLMRPPVTLHWTRGSGHDNISPRERDGVSLETERAAGTSRSTLFLRHVELSDTGNYTCLSDSHARTVLVVVTGSLEPPDPQKFTGHYGHGSNQGRQKYIKSQPTPRSDGTTSSVQLMTLIFALIVSMLLHESQ